MKCPICVDESLVMSDRQGIEIDYCQKCRGVWLDRGELDKIIERSAPSQPETRTEYREPSRSSGYQQQNHNQHYNQDHRGHHKKKKGGLLSELFDF